MSAAVPPEPAPPEPDAGASPPPEPPRERVELAVARAGARATVTTAVIAALAALLGAAIGAGATYFHDTSQLNESDHARLRAEVTAILNDQEAVYVQEQAYADALLVDNTNPNIRQFDVRTIDDSAPDLPRNRIKWPPSALARIKGLQQPFKEAMLKVDVDADAILADNPPLGAIASGISGWDQAVYLEIESAVLTGTSHPDNAIIQNRDSPFSLGRPRKVSFGLVEGLQLVLDGQDLNGPKP